MFWLQYWGQLWDQKSQKVLWDRAQEVTDGLQSDWTQKRYYCFKRLFDKHFIDLSRHLIRFLMRSLISWFRIALFVLRLCRPTSRLSEVSQTLFESDIESNERQKCYDNSFIRSLSWMSARSKVISIFGLQTITEDNLNFRSYLHRMQSISMAVQSVPTSPVSKTSAVQQKSGGTSSATNFFTLRWLFRGSKNSSKKKLKQLNNKTKEKIATISSNTTKKLLRQSYSFDDIKNFGQTHLKNEQNLKHFNQKYANHCKSSLEIENNSEKKSSTQFKCKLCLADKPTIEMHAIWSCGCPFCKQVTHLSWISSFPLPSFPDSHSLLICVPRRVLPSDSALVIALDILNIDI